MLQIAYYNLINICGEKKYTIIYYLFFCFGWYLGRKSGSHPLLDTAHNTANVLSNPGKLIISTNVIDDKDDNDTAQFQLIKATFIVYLR